MKKFKAKCNLEDHRGLLFIKDRAYIMLDKQTSKIYKDKIVAYTLESEVGPITFSDIYIDKFDEIINEMPKMNG